MYRFPLSIFSVCAFMLSVPALAQAASEQPGGEMQAAEPEIIVTGLTKPYKLTGKQLVRALRAFDAKRGQLARAAQLYFRVAPKVGGDLSEIDLFLKRGDEIVTLPLDNQNRFVLPPLNGEDWTLFANRNRGGIVVTPTVLSPGTSDRSRLLGDLRLQCEVYWAMSSPETSIIVRAMFSAAGGCKSNKFGFYVSTDAAISSGTVTNGATVLPLRLWGDHKYQAPIGVKTLPNSARVTLIPS